MTGTSRSSASRRRSVEVRARSTPPPARITGRSARGEELEDRADLVGLGSGRGRTSGVERRPGRDLLVEKVLGQREEHGTGPADERGPDRVTDGRRDVRRRPDLGGVGRQPAERCRLLDLLERLAAAESPLDLPDEGEHRARILAGGMDADREVRGADGAGRETDRRAAGQLAVGLGHERRGALVAGADDPDAGGVEALEQAEEAFARHGERVADADGAEGVGDVPADAAGGFGLGRAAGSGSAAGSGVGLGGGLGLGGGSGSGSAAARVRARRPAAGSGSAGSAGSASGSASAAVRVERRDLGPTRARLRGRLDGSA